MNRNKRQDEVRLAGFTLVEMLVSTGLVVLIMMLFAQIYGTAVGTITEQRGMANNDQKARILSSVIRGDLQNMTYRQPAYPYGNVQGIVPMAAGDEPIIDPVNQRGYFYFSENDPAADWDDVLQFTTMIRAGQRGNAPTRNQQRPYVGKATSLSTSYNEPDLDDGIADGVGQSRAAEICYFLRNGNLYRRVLLLREPLPKPMASDSQPTTSTGSRVFSGAGTSTYNQFYGNFDYSATRASDSAGSYPWFHSIKSLQNNIGQSNMPLALSHVRFGFNPASKLPVEYDQSNTFLGRFTTQETSSSNFYFPGQPISSSNPYAAAVIGSLNVDGVVGNYSGNDRIGEDILLTNVESFDVKVLDFQPNTEFGEFVNINGTFTNGTPATHYASSQNSTYTSGNGMTNIYDTWHPSMTIGIAPYSPPYRPILNSPTNTWASLAGTANSSSVLYVPALIYDVTTPRASNSLVYRAVNLTSSSTGTKQPEFPPVPGTIVQDGGVTWQCVDNRIGLKAIQITIRYRDVSSNLSRQVTLVHSFVE